MQIALFFWIKVSIVWFWTQTHCIPWNTIDVWSDLLSSACFILISRKATNQNCKLINSIVLDNYQQVSECILTHLNIDTLHKFNWQIVSNARNLTNNIITYVETDWLQIYLDSTATKLSIIYVIINILFV